MKIHTVLSFQMSRCQFLNCQDLLDCRDVFFLTVETENRDADCVKNRDFKELLFSKMSVLNL
jgi:hypothetical protein